MAWSKIPLVRIVIPFVFGILLFVELDIAIAFSKLLCTLVLSIILFLYLVIKEKSFRNRWWVGVTGNVVVYLIGGLSVIFVKSSSHPIQNLTNEKLLIIAELDDLSRKGEKGTASAIVKLKSIKWKDSTLKVEHSAKAQIYINSTVSEQIHLGDKVVFQSYLNIPNPALNPYDFDYAEFLAKRGIYHQGFTDTLYLLERNITLAGYAFKLREFLIDQFQQAGIESDELSVLIALSLGDKSRLSNEVKERYAGAGAMHILAVSGLHVGIIYLIFNTLFRIGGKRSWQRWLKAFLLLLVIWGFAFITGLSPSVQRAGCMFSFIIFANALKRNSNILNSISAAALIILFINPYQLYEVGFQLSFAAVIGIVSIHPKIYPWLSFNNILANKVWSLMVVSIAAQLATLPFALFYFHQFPNWFLLTNLFVIPLAFVIVGLAVLVSLLWLLFQSDFYFAKCLDFFLSTLNYIIQTLELLPYFNTEGIWIGALTSLLLAVSIILFVGYLSFVKNSFLMASLSVFVSLLIIETLFDYHQLKRDYFAYYAASNELIMIVKEGGEGFVIHDSDSISEYEKRVIHNHLNAEATNHIKFINLNDSLEKSNLSFQIRTIGINHYISYKNQLHLILNDDKIDLSKLDYPISTILLNKPRILEEIVSKGQNFEAENLIIGSQVKLWAQSLIDFEVHWKESQLSTSVSNLIVLNRDGYQCFEQP